MLSTRLFCFYLRQAYPIGFCLSRLGFAFRNVMYPPNQAFDMGGAKQVEIFLLAGGMALLAIAAFVFPMNKISHLFFLGQKVWLPHLSDCSISCMFTEFRSS